ncbi:hypothetical protein JS82_05660 [Methanomassiliicoccaceae archaeon DOK]|nr:hypothetical protein JS82_05660 [Methanomassiliicoccaceae archaeon DOK]
MCNTTKNGDRNISKLYIIGNGFDIHHGLKTNYSYYGDFLKKNHPEVYEWFNSLTDLRTRIDFKGTWSEVEKSLEIDFDALMERAFQYYPDMMDDNPKWDDMRITIDEHTRYVDEFTGKYFSEWLNNLDFTNVQPDLRLPQDGLYLNFNYTDTLSRLYEIPDENVLHIHGSLKLLNSTLNDEEIHNTIQFGSSELNESIVEQYKESYNDNEFYGVSIEPCLLGINHYITMASKDLNRNYEPLRKFLQRGDIDSVTILGHSVLKADYPYYRDVIVPALHDCSWHLYYHDDGRESILNFIGKFQLRNFELKEW